MPTYKFKIGDKVFFFKNDMSDWSNINWDSVGKVLSLKDNLNTPYCYEAEFIVNRITEEEDGLITRTDVPVTYAFNEHQLGFIDSTLYSEDYKFDADYYDEHQMVRVSADGLISGANETDIGIITKIKIGSANIVWIRTATGQQALDLDSLIEQDEILPFLYKDIETTDSLGLKQDLKKIGRRLHTYEHGDFDLCVVCNCWTWESDHHRVAGYGVMCPDCWNEFQISCYGCEQVYNIRSINHHNYQGNDYCQACYDDKIFKCSGCSSTFEDLTPFIYDNHRYCENCYERRALGFMSHPPRMLSRSSISKLLLPSDKLYNQNKSKTAVAIEIEAINDGCEDIEEAVYHMPAGWNDAYDGSISTDMSREFIMQPEVGDAALNRVKTFCNWLDKEGWYINSSCGIHVHTDAFYLGVNELKGILLTARALEPLIYSMLPDSRSKSRYSKPMENIDSQVILDVKSTSDLCQLWYEVMNGTHASSEKYNDSRYRGFNLHSRFLHGTIEYRYHHGTLSDYYINNWIMFCLAISDFGTTLLSKDKKTVNLFVDGSKNKYTVLLEAMGISNLIPYIEEMIARKVIGSAPQPNEINGEVENWSSHV